jgi:hypothetical protein
LGEVMDAKEFQKALTKEAVYLRGQIITGYSLIEYVLADISVRLDLKFPYRIKDRIKAAKKIVDRPDYEAYRHDFHRVCDEDARTVALEFLVKECKAQMRANGERPQGGIHDAAVAQVATSQGMSPEALKQRITRRKRRASR